MNEPIRIANEFSYIEVRKIQTKNGEMLEIESKKGERKIILDAMQLESLTLLTPEDFSLFFELHYGADHSPGKINR